MVRILFAIIFLCAAVSSMSVAIAERRVALVVGNSDYEHSSKLANPINDANDVTSALEDVGFKVITVTDVDIDGFRAAIDAFAREASGADVSLFYYSGHGMQWEGQNMLVPTDATLDNADIVPFEVLPLTKITNALSLARNAKILILDACRDNDAERSLKIALAEKQGKKSTAVDRGLTPLNATEGQVVIFATQPNRTASDDFEGSSRNSPFTHAFLETIKEPGLEIGRTFRKVAARVNKLTRGAQRPEMSISLLGDFFFVPDKIDAGESDTVPVVCKAADWAGLWKTTYQDMRLRVSGNSVTGEYQTGFKHSVKGRFLGSDFCVLIGEWDHNNGTPTGYFRFVITRPKHFAGSWHKNIPPSAGATINWTGDHY